MREKIPKSHILIFIGTKNSLNSKDCRYELSLAKKYDLQILTLKGADITWKDLDKIDLREHNQGIINLSRTESFEFSARDFDELSNKLYEYMEEQESNRKLHKKERKEFELDDIISMINKYFTIIMESKEFRNNLKENIEKFENIFQQISENRITTLEYFLKLVKILEKKILSKINI